VTVCFALDCLHNSHEDQGACLLDDEKRVVNNQARGISYEADHQYLKQQFKERNGIRHYVKSCTLKFIEACTNKNKGTYNG